MLVERHVDQRVQADDGVEGRWGEIERGRIGPDEGRAGYQVSGAADLDIAEVHAGDRVSRGGQRSCQGEAASAAEVEHGGAGREALA